MAYLSTLRAEVSSLQSAILDQQPRFASGTIQRAAMELRGELSELREAQARRRTRLVALRGRANDVGSLAGEVERAAHGAAEMLRRERHSTYEEARRQPPRGGSLAHTATMRSTAAEREEHLRAARERMARRLGGVIPSGDASDAARRRGAGRGGGMFERLSALRDAPPSSSLPPSAPEALGASALASLRELEVVCSRTLPDVCCVCLEQRRQGQRVLHLACGHCFHGACAQRWLGCSACCPLCKTPVTGRA